MHKTLERRKSLQVSGGFTADKKNNGTAQRLDGILLTAS